MNSNKSIYPQLPRYRRRSNPASPTSPVFQRRTVEVTSKPADGVKSFDTRTSFVTTSESPVIEVQVPSPAFDAKQANRSEWRAGPNAQKPPLSLSEEYGAHYGQMHEEEARPQMSSTVDVKAGQSGSTRDAAAPDTYRLSPMLHSPRYGESRDRFYPDGSRRSVENTSPNMRSFAFNSQLADRPISEESTSSKSGKKSRLNMLNPMSLLARRRSSQNQRLDDVNLSINTLAVPALPDNFEPSIRGNILHDFSAPRPRKVYTQAENFLNVDPNRRPGSALTPDTPGSFESRSSRPLQSGTIPPAQVLSPLHQENVRSEEKESPYQQVRQPSNTSQESHHSRLGGDKEAQTDSNVALPPEPEDSPPPPPPPKRTPSPPQDAILATVLPKHMRSTSSRFSFQLSGPASSAQERLLEERHKQHQATKTSRFSGFDAEDFDADNYDSYDFDDDGLEEKIPGVNADFEEDDYEEEIPGVNADFEEPDANDQLLQLSSQSGIEDAAIKRKNSCKDHDATDAQSFQAFHFTPQSMTFSPTSPQYTSHSTPRDNEGFPIGIADSQDFSHVESEHYSQSNNNNNAIELGLEGLGISSPALLNQATIQSTDSKTTAFSDEDLYFNDGEFDTDLIPSDAHTFDENIFDDESSDIRDIPAENARKYDVAMKAAGAGGHVKVSGPPRTFVGPKTEHRPPFVGSDPRNLTIDTALSNRPVAQPQPQVVTGLTEGNLAAYHDALALAANDAAASGRFSRNVSFSQTSEDDSSQSPPDGSRPGFISDGSRYGHQFGGGIAEDDGFPFDDDLDDDLMIAEANAEALENDDEGFYGQEFGFYARAHGKDSTDMVNGGYFASRGSNGVKRSHSSKGKFQEPSLTPITEQSEWSTRNSVASLVIPQFPGSAQSIPSPGIAQLLELDSPALDEDMTLSALMKLRRGAWGGSSSSVSSLGGGHTSSSPLSNVATHHFPPSEHSHGRMSHSVHSFGASAGIPESEEETDSVSGRVSINQRNALQKNEDSTLSTPVDTSAISPSFESNDFGRRRHRRTSSGAESVSYARENDGRWVLERRRTDENGGPEIIDREYLAGTRI